MNELEIRMINHIKLTRHDKKKSYLKTTVNSEIPLFEIKILKCFYLTITHVYIKVNTTYLVFIHRYSVGDIQTYRKSLYEI